MQTLVLLLVAWSSLFDILTRRNRSAKAQSARPRRVLTPPWRLKKPF